MDEAIAAYREAIQLKPKYANAHYGLGNALSGPGEFRGGDRPVSRGHPPEAGLRRGPQQPRQRFESQGRVTDAIAEYHAAIRIKPELVPPPINLGDVHYGLGKALLAQKKFEEAIAQYHEAIRLAPESAGAHIGLGNALKGQGKLRDAIAEYRDAIRLKPDYAMAHNNCAWAWSPPPSVRSAITRRGWCTHIRPSSMRRRAKTATARWRWPSIVRGTGPSHWPPARRSMALSKGGNASDWFFMAMALWQKGDKDKARMWFEKAVAWTREKDPKNKELLQFWEEAGDILGQPVPQAAATPSTSKPR